MQIINFKPRSCIKKSSNHLSIIYLGAKYKKGSYKKTQNNSKNFNKMQNTTQRKSQQKYQTRQIYSEKILPYDMEIIQNSSIKYQSNLISTSLNLNTFSLNLSKRIKNINEANKVEKPSINKIYQQWQKKDKAICEKIKQKNNISKHYCQIRDFSQLSSESKNCHNFQQICLIRTVSTCNQQSINYEKQQKKHFENIRLCESIIQVTQNSLMIEESVIMNFDVLDNFKILIQYNKSQNRILMPAIQTNINLLVMIKKYKTVRLTQIYNEIQIYKKLMDCKNVLNFYTFILHKNLEIYIITEYFCNTLQDIKNNLNYRDIHTILLQVLFIIQQLCSNYILQELNLQNIMVINNVCKIGNFQRAQYRPQLNMNALNQQYLNYYYELMNELINVQHINPGQEKYWERIKDILAFLKQNKMIELSQLKTMVQNLQNNF